MAGGVGSVAVRTLRECCKSKARPGPRFKKSEGEKNDNRKLKLKHKHAELLRLMKQLETLFGGAGSRHPARRAAAQALEGGVRKFEIIKFQIHKLGSRSHALFSFALHSC